MRGKSIRLFLVEGSATGLIVAEVGQWTGIAVTGSRSSLAAAVRRPESEKAGVYILWATDGDYADRNRVYIGESETIRKRLSQHNQSMDFWERFAFFSSKDQNLTKVHAKYLESRLIRAAAEGRRVSLNNSTQPDPPALPDADIAEMEFFLEQVHLVLPTLGLRIEGHISERASTSEAKGHDEFVFSVKSAEARAWLEDGELVVSAGSTAIASTSAKMTSYVSLRQSLISDGVLAPVEGTELLRFTEDTTFASLSAAAAVIAGRNQSGPQGWRHAGTGQTYADWIASQAEDN